jgi:hypothetical protein
MWYRNVKIAEQGIMDLNKRLFQGAEQAIINWIKSSLVDGDISDSSSEYKGYYILSNIKIPNWLSGFVNKINFTKNPSAAGIFYYESKTLELPYAVPKNYIQILLGDILHEIRHAVDPRAKNQTYFNWMKQNHYYPSNIQKYLAEWHEKTGEIISYSQMILNLTEYKKKTEYANYEGDTNKLFDKLFQEIKQMYPRSMYEKVLQSSNDLYLNNPLEHSSQLGDVRRLLNKSNLDFVKEKYYANLNIKQWKDFLKNTLMKKNSAEFQTLSDQIQEVSGNKGQGISYIVNEVKDLNWQKQYAKQVTNALNEYIISGNPLTNLIRRENRNVPANQNAAKNLQTYLTKAIQLEQLATRNPEAWSKFINYPAISKMINRNVLGMFKNIGTGSKSLSQSLKGLNMNSPLWALLEPALEFGLYQFGLYLENPSAFSLETPEQKTIRELNARINTIIADPKIRDKRGYFIKNYGSYLKTLGSIQQNELLGKFPVMGFDNFMNIGKNIGQR